MHDSIQPNEWVCFKFPSEQVRVLQVIPNTTVALGKYGSFPANLLLGRPFHVTYEVQDRRDGEDFCRLRIVPAVEVHADTLAEMHAAPTPAQLDQTPTPITATPAGPILAGVDGDVTLSLPVADQDGEASVRPRADDRSRQAMTLEEIEVLKKHGADSGRDLVARLMMSHTALDQKTAFSLAKYKLLKIKKYLRRFVVMPLNAATLGHWLLVEKEGIRIMDMREETLALIGCWANVHFAEGLPGAEPPWGDAVAEEEQTAKASAGRWLVIDDTGGLLTASMAERMGILHAAPPPVQDKPNPAHLRERKPSTALPAGTTDATDTDDARRASESLTHPDARPKPHHKHHELALATANTITVLHANSQPNLSALAHYGFHLTGAPNRPPFHPLDSRLFAVTWLQLLEPEADTIYAARPDTVPSEEVSAWKASRRSAYFRKHRRWSRLKQIVDSARAGGFSGFAMASTMDPITVLKHTLPLLGPGAPVAVYSPTIEPLAELADCFSIARRTAWSAFPGPGAGGKTARELERWPGSGDFPLNPTLLLGSSLQSSRARRWQVLPGRTHPLMTSRGGPEGYVFTAWRAVPAEGKVTARGKYKRRKLNSDGAAGTR